jgi:hypothetical protein
LKEEELKVDPLNASMKQKSLMEPMEPAMVALTEEEQ